MTHAMRIRMTALSAVAGLVAVAAWLSIGAATASGAPARSLDGWPGSRPAASAAEATQMAMMEHGGESRGQLLIVRSRAVREAFVDVGRGGESPGDFILFEETVRGRNGGRVIGRDSVRGELALRTFTIEGTIQIFRKGKIRIASTVFAERDNAYAVTGGTGAYKGVGGELSVFDLAGGDTLLVFDLVR